MIGLLGSHRTGKTTLAKVYAEKHDLIFVETSVSSIFKQMGLDPAAKFKFKERLEIQEEVLRSVEEIYNRIDPSVSAIADRTPLDMLAYTMSEAIGDSVGKREQAKFASYVRRCFEVTNRRFSSLILVQPGIPVIAMQGKAIANEAYMEHLNSLMLGLSLDERIKVPHFYIPRGVLSLEGRVTALDGAVNMVTRSAQHEVEQYTASGGKFQ
ncbi:hypothetical protein QN372_00130 [Undibacterium sp. RTI2.1]|uniref:hypothetical protein n=1 Tax=Undibacterium sp. RTI2.1 TaxID=3048637 RepID=UPI002B239F7A|nr:hypothetical protein [Undibacterium sp. RTI2.1]MEB0029145.1 hypothetical protein [Undibacterium sp. RTI2.1]MEB0231932.1 hypothetical protein [Undibacterium sp. 10I3]